MRIFNCTIVNDGEGDIEWVDDHLDHGEWSENLGPSQGTGLIKPSARNTFESRSGGSIPIFGSIGTGTEGWAIFKTHWAEFIGQSQEAYIKISWNLPFIKTSSDSPCAVETFRFDPRQPESPFGETDKTKPGLHISSFVGNDGDGDDNIVQGLPWLVIFPAFFPLAGDVKYGIFLHVKNTVPLGSSKLPLFAEPQTVNTVTEAARFTNPSMWVGRWASESISSYISTNPDGTLNVSITEKRSSASGSKTDYTFETSNAPIHRLLYSFSESAGRTLSRKSQATVARNFSEDLNIYVSKQFSSKRITREDVDKHSIAYSKIVNDNFDIYKNYTESEHQIGGDYLSLANDATLELYKIASGGKVVDAALRYRRPSGGPAMLSLTHFDEMLRYIPDVR